MFFPVFALLTLDEMALLLFILAGDDVSFSRYVDFEDDGTYISWR